jgi:hypothetical protein
MSSEQPSQALPSEPEAPSEDRGDRQYSEDDSKVERRKSLPSEVLFVTMLVLPSASSLNTLSDTPLTLITSLVS